MRESGETVAWDLRPSLVDYACGLGLTPEDAEEVVQSAFRQLFSNRPDLDSAEAWLKTVIASRAVDLDRRARTAQEFRANGAGDGAEGAVVPDLDTGIWVRTALAGLPARVRRLLVLRYWEGATDAEAAARTGYRVDSVPKTIRRALARLRRGLGGSSVGARR